MSSYDKYRIGGKRLNKQLPEHKIIAWVEENFEFKKRKGGAEYKICNPFDGDTKFKFNINPSKGVCHDWRGDEWAGPINPESGKRNCSFIKFVRAYRKCSYREALEEVLGTSGDVAEFMRPENRAGLEEAKRTIAVALPDTACLLSSSTDRQAKIVITWLKSRGYTDETIAKHELYHSGMDVYWPYFEFDTFVYWQSRSRLNKRFEFPATNIYNRDGNIVGHTDGSKGDYLYGFDDAEQASYLIITEAIFDQHTLGTQALASGGAALTSTQIQKIKLLGPRYGVILSPDNDKAGIMSLLNNASVLEHNNLKVLCSVPPSIEYIDQENRKKKTKDWNELFTKVGLSLKDIRELFDKNIKKLTMSTRLQLREKADKLSK